MRSRSFKKVSHYVFTSEDERLFSERIKNQYPEAVFIDGIRWPTSQPPTKPSLSECEESWAYIWNPVIYPSLPFEPTADSRFRGPQSGLVIALKRSVTGGAVMRSGDISIGITVEREGVDQMRDFSKYVWEVFIHSGQRKVMQLDTSSELPIRERRDILVGTHAACWCLESADRHFVFHNAPDIRMRPVQ